jgi:23S rRNA 5-hydroxycytidine C2501 synthase
MTPIELLSPAKDLECGKAAIDNGADAVYIGGPSFGARAAAGNSMADIEELARYAHQFCTKVYLTLNTILFDDELDSARMLARQAWDAGVDALIIQDMGLLELDLPPLPLIASTQMNNADAAHIRFLEQVGFVRVILARELTLSQIREIRQNTSIELESFVHGALCVGYSGRCYLSASLGGRSSNRGTCGQPCRLPWTLADADGHVLEHNRYLLSLKDMDRSSCLVDMIESGVTAFKIEGRLKDISYVKNVTAYYRTRLDKIIETRPELKRASSGRSEISFSPDPSKTFCRGATTYLINSEADDIWSPDTPKSMGEEIGTVIKCGPDWFELSKGAVAINAGDGLCFFDENKELQGLQVIKVIDQRTQVHLSCGGLKSGMTIFRNRDHQFLKHLDTRVSVRRLALHMTFREIPDGFVLEGLDEDGIHSMTTLLTTKEPAEKPEAAVITMKKQLSKLNDSIFYLVSLNLETRPYFLRASELNQLRRDLVSLMENNREQAYTRLTSRAVPDPSAPYPLTELDYSYNISNNAAHEFYQKHGVTAIEPAFELQQPAKGAVVMRTKHCLRRCLNACNRKKDQVPLAEPLNIENAGRRFRLVFDCNKCCMHIVMD